MDDEIIFSGIMLSLKFVNVDYNFIGNSQGTMFVFVL